MRKYTTLAMVLFALQAFGQEDGIGLFCVPEGIASQIDGSEGKGEWSDADSFFINEGEANEVEVKMKHDNFSFFFAFYGDLSDNFQFPEVYLDLNYDQSTEWQPDDWWFHVSATDCDNQGAPSIFTNCSVEQPDWFAAPNFEVAQLVDFVEIEIPFVALEVETLLNDTIGLGLAVSDTQTFWDMWPEWGDYQNPQSWVPVIVCSESVGLDDHLISSFSIFPNPTQGALTFETKSAVGETYQIISLTGKERLTGIIQRSSERIDLSHLAPGIYFARLGDRQLQKLVVQP